MPNMKIDPDIKRFTRYQSVINILLIKDSFCKSEIYESLKEEKPQFIGRIISDLVKDGYLTNSGSKTKPQYSWSAKRDELNAGRWIDQRVFTPTVKRSPSIDRPRERLLRLGPSELKISELLAILIRSGLRGESAMQAGERLATLFGNNLEKLSLQARGELKQVSKAIGETAYCQIMAGLELGKRLASQRTTESVPHHKVRNTSDAFTYCKEHFMRLAREAKQEEFHIVLLDEKHRVIRSEQITVGLINQSLAHPREVFKPAVKESASALILVHNHPSGDPTPSQDDRTITKDLKRAAETLGLRILDHIILCKDKALSMAEEKLL
ncbi:MAG: DNA repair protein RadC [Thermodesulfobacteriota bacterium]|nr:DNA repair protein RadC [Thermodesulfobacteriota bacterium]